MKYILLFTVGWIILGFSLTYVVTPETPVRKHDIFQEVKSLREDLNQLTIVVSELDKTVIVVDGQVADETFDWNEFHNVPKGK